MILVKPIITERSLAEAQHSRYTFEVKRWATKGQIKAEVERQFGIKVISATTVTTQGKSKKNWRNRKISQDSPTKKARVVIPADQKIELFETSEKK